MPFLDVLQGSDAWLEARKGCITGSRFKDCRGRKKTGEWYKASTDYAQEVARERLGGTAASKFQNAAMRTGTEQEPFARAMYEGKTGNMVDEVGFYVTDDRQFGLSPDGLIDNDGVLEVKTLVSSDVLFNVVVDGDISAYVDQCIGYLWLLGRQWVDLCIWVPDLDYLKIHRIERDESEIEKLESDLLEFVALAKQYETKLRLALGKE